MEPCVLRLASCVLRLASCVLELGSEITMEICNHSALELVPGPRARFRNHNGDCNAENGTFSCDLYITFLPETVYTLGVSKG